MVDLLRASIVCTSGTTMVQLLRTMVEGFKLPTMQEASVSLVRLKNKFAKVDPTHFRNVLCNLRLECAGMGSALVELQVRFVRCVQKLCTCQQKAKRCVALLL